MTFLLLLLIAIGKAHSQDTVVFLGYFISFFHRTTSKKICVKKEYYYAKNHRKMPFLLIFVVQIFVLTITGKLSQL